MLRKMDNDVLVLNKPKTEFWTSCMEQLTTRHNGRVIYLKTFSSLRSAKALTVLL